MQINKFSIYELGYQEAEIPQKDKVDIIVDEIIDLHAYEDVQDYVKRTFGEFDGIQWFNFSELNKLIYVLNENDKIEICMFKNKKQYYGKGWKPIKEDLDARKELL